MSHRIIFLDSNVAEYQNLIPQLPENSEVIILGASEDGVIKIMDALQGKTEIGVIDIISHGAPGSLMLGSIELNNANLTEYAEQLTQMGAHLRDTADILLYGCEVAQGKQGQAFIEQLSLLVGANVAASINLTGAEALGGDWILGAYTGLNKVSALHLSYSGVLSSVEFRVNTYTDNVQAESSIAGLSTGGFVVSWTSDDQDGKFNSIYAQRYDRNGVAQGAEFRVNTTTADPQFNSWVSALPNGDFVVNWMSSDSDLHLQRYDANGIVQGGEVKVLNVNPFIVSPIAALSDGGFVTNWHGLAGIYAQRYDANGVAQGPEFKVNTTRDDGQTESSITGLSDGGFVASWTSEVRDGFGVDSDEIFAQRYDANGVTQGPEFRVNTTTDDDQKESSISGLTNGGFVVSWISADQDVDKHGGGIYAQRYDASGVAQGAEFQINTTTVQFPDNSSLTALSNGGFVAIWQTLDVGSPSFGIFVQRFDANGVAQGDELRVNTTIETSSDPSIAALNDGGFVVSWQAADDIKAKRYDANGNEVAGVDFSATADRLFNWAESAYTTLFPTHAASQEIEGYHARLYENGNALGEQSGNIYFYDSHSIVLVGTVDDFLPSAIAAGF
ncbi:MAG: DUF4347 domain-containing protein [Nitrosomonas sp.]|nr:DUF4347 domain-containing protein [Nitrosomonas sp.]MBP6075599.1 DUF4347 domain-containing protein [Nitrosomonas sp.]